MLSSEILRLHNYVEIERKELRKNIQINISLILHGLFHGLFITMFMLGDAIAGVTPLSIPNREVKPC